MYVSIMTGAARHALLSPPLWAGLLPMLRAWLPPPERGRVGVGVNWRVGVDSRMWSAAVCLGNWRSETPSRLAALADLPLSGGGEDALLPYAIALPLMGRGGEGGATQTAACNLPPFLALPHKGGGNGESETRSIAP